MTAVAKTSPRNAAIALLWVIGFAAYLVAFAMFPMDADRAFRSWKNLCFPAGIILAAATRRRPFVSALCWAGFGVLAVVLAMLTPVR
ncbi:hypothetical protein [Nitrospirillum iridis]|uniref:Transmembrane protein n=1 Tax=Nitrospirillum iridis TaxID=765888 RepID=A0A7X0AYK7_9PROT|nr:hypothetical protein [Nitrospirillum iridis]MBB6251455.1 hypothetical protein [Nitrospirillum iridis]